MKYDKYGYEIKNTISIEFITLIPKNIAADLSSLREIYEKRINTPTYKYYEFLSFRNLFYIDINDLVKYDLDYMGHVFVNPITENNEQFHILVLEDAITAGEILKISPDYILMEANVQFEDLWKINRAFLELNSLRNELPKLETGEYYLLYKEFSVVYPSSGSTQSSELHTFKIKKEILLNTISHASEIEILWLDGYEISHNYDDYDSLWRHPYNKYVGRTITTLLNFFKPIF
ncbi:MAG: hypothetical protein ACFFDH_23025 [Promethearchaeota archaeon]